jgi:hypothetical protein
MKACLELNDAAFECGKHRSHLLIMIHFGHLLLMASVDYSFPVRFNIGGTKLMLVSGGYIVERRFNWIFQTTRKSSATAPFAGRLGRC